MKMVMVTAYGNGTEFYKMRTIEVEWKRVKFELLLYSFCARALDTVHELETEMKI